MPGLLVLGFNRSPRLGHDLREEGMLPSAWEPNVRVQAAQFAPATQAPVQMGAEHRLRHIGPRFA